MSHIRMSKLFYHHGLFFGCKQCGHCCTGDPGIVAVSETEMTTIAAYLNFSPDAFVEKHCHSFRGELRLNENAQGVCVFFDQGCRIYPVRPRQCQTFPFWFSALRSEERWRKTVKDCPGIGQGKLVTRQEIERLIGEELELKKRVQHGTPVWECDW